CCRCRRPGSPRRCANGASCRWPSMCPSSARPGAAPSAAPCSCATSSARGRGAGPSSYLAVVDELDRDIQIGALDQGDHGLQVVALLTRDAQLIALDLGLDALGPLIADQLRDLLRVLGRDPLAQNTCGAIDLS